MLRLQKKKKRKIPKESKNEKKNWFIFRFIEFDTFFLYKRSKIILFQFLFYFRLNCIQSNSFEVEKIHLICVAGEIENSIAIHIKTSSTSKADDISSDKFNHDISSDRVTGVDNVDAWNGQPP